MKVLLVQLPVPDNRHTNLPLAIGYLKAASEAANLPGVGVGLLEAEVQNRAGDARLVEAILAHDPDIVGFSLYTWNSSRALKVAGLLKERAPEIRLVGGGPEVNHDGDWILNSPDLDFVVLGEGERTFVELLQVLNGGKQPESDLAGIAGLGRPVGEGSQRKWHFGPGRAALADVNLVPSAYLSGALEGHLGRFMSIELSRWCPSKCTFCYYGRQDLPRGGKRYFDLERVRQELLFGMAAGVEQVHFVEANFNTLPHLAQLYDTILETGAARRMNFYAELRGEAIDTAQARRLAECNFSTVEVGLQSAVPEVLAKVRRKNNLPRLVQGVHNLREQGTEVFLDVIVGLPGETEQTFQQTLDFVTEHELAPFDLFNLQILPGTQLKAEVEAGQHGMRYQSAPPYFALETAELSFEQLAGLRRQVMESKGLDPAQVGGRPAPGPFSLAECDGQGLAATGSGGEIVERVVLDLRGSGKVWPDTGLARQLGSEVMVWLRLGEATELSLAEAVRWLDVLSAPNPSGLWQLFVEANRGLSLTELQQLTGAINHAEGYLDRLAVFARHEQKGPEVSRWPSVNLFQVLPVGVGAQVKTPVVRAVWLDEYQSTEEWQAQLEKAARDGEAGLYVQLAYREAFFPKFKARWETVAGGMAQPVWFADWRFAAALTASEAEDSTDMLTSLEYPVTASLHDNSLDYVRVARTQLEKVALVYQLARVR